MPSSSGREDDALGWMRFARAAQIGGNADAETQVAGFWLLATLGALAWDGPRDPARLDAWRQAQERIDARTAPAPRFISNGNGTQVRHAAISA